MHSVHPTAPRLGESILRIIPPHASPARQSCPEQNSTFPFRRAKKVPPPIPVIPVARFADPLLPSMLDRENCFGKPIPSMSHPGRSERSATVFSNGGLRVLPYGPLRPSI